MYLDRQLMFSDKQTLAVAAGTVASTDVIDNGVARNVGRAGRLRLSVTVDEALTGGTSVEVRLVESDAANLASPKLLVSSGAIAQANTPKAGRALFDVVLPDTSKRFLGVQYVLVGTHTAGKVTAALVTGTDHNPPNPANTGR
jgi:hypothetical protein